MVTVNVKQFKNKNFNLNQQKTLLQKTKQVPLTHAPKKRMMRSREITL